MRKRFQLCHNKKMGYLVVAAVVILSSSAFSLLSRAFVFQSIIKQKTLRITSTLFAVSDKELVQNAEVLLIAPTLSIPAEQFTALKIPNNIKTSVITKNNLISYVDGTPFCLIVDHITTSNFCIFAKESDSDLVDQFLMWVKKVKPNSNYNEVISGFLICKKTNVLKLFPSTS